MDTAPVSQLAALKERIAKAARQAGRRPEHIHLIGIAKLHGPDRIRPVLAAGLRDFGENRVQEAQTKWPELRRDFPDLRLHLVGPLQTNKLRDALDLFDVFHTLDRPKLARKLAGEVAAGARCPDLFVQVNTGEEPQKSGVAPRDLDAFLNLVRGELHLPVGGLMCLPPLNEEPALHFALLAKLARRHGLTRLSMGMSADFETAIAFGATHIRIGTALFGERPQKAAQEKQELPPR